MTLSILHSRVIIHRENTTAIYRIKHDRYVINIHSGIFFLPFLCGMLVETVHHGIFHRFVVVVVGLEITYHPFFLPMNQRIVLEHRKLSIGNQQTTAQVNMILSDGNLAEIQIRGEGPFGEYEHLAYDSKKGKNTLGEVFQGYKKEVQGLKDKEYDRYNDNYISPCYDYYRDAELGIISTKPKLPSEFNPILSEENMQRLHLANEKDQAEKMKTFVPHIEYSKTKTFLG